MFLHEAAEFEEPKLANSGVSGRTSNNLCNATTSLGRILQAVMLPTLQAAMFLNRFFFKNSTSVHVERMKPVWEPAPVLFHRCRLPRLEEALLFHWWQQVKLQLCKAAADPFKPKEVFPRPAKLAVRSPTPVEDRNRGSTGSRFIPKMSRSVPDVILSPLSEPPVRSAIESPRISYGVELEKFPTSSTFNFWQLNFRPEVCSASYHPQDIDELRKSLSVGKHPSFEMLDAKVATAREKFRRTRISRRKSFWKSRTPKKTNDFVEDDISPV